jgi:hypothetical protein
MPVRCNGRKCCPSHRPCHPNLTCYHLRFPNLTIICPISPSPIMPSIPSRTCHPDLTHCCPCLPNLAVIRPTAPTSPTTPSHPCHLDLTYRCPPQPHHHPTTAVRSYLLDLTIVLIVPAHHPNLAPVVRASRTLSSSAKPYLLRL